MEECADIAEFSSTLSNAGMGALWARLLHENQLYLVTSAEHSLGRSHETVAAAALAGGVRMVQLREKHLRVAVAAERKTLVQSLRSLRVLTRAAGAALVLNDHLDIALAEADGVHLGQADVPLREALIRRAQCGREHDFIIGYSTHSEAELRAAVTTLGAAPLVYVNIGPVFQTQTKQHTAPPLGVAEFCRLRALAQGLAPALPVTAMGGIKEQRLAALVAAGATHFAMITELTTAVDICAKARALHAVVNAALQSLPVPTAQQPVIVA